MNRSRNFRTLILHSVIFLSIVATLASLNQISSSQAAQLDPLDSTGWLGEASIQVEQREYLLGESVVLHYEITNTRDTPVEIDWGGDYRGAPRPLRFKVLAFDSNGKVVDDPYGKATHSGGRAESRTLQAGESTTTPFPLMRYCDIQTAGEYTIRVYHALGWDDELPVDFNGLPKGKHTAPIAEAKITFAMPNKLQAKELVNKAADLLRRSPTRVGWKHGNADFTVFRQPVYLPYLVALTRGSSSAVGAASVQGLAEIPTPEATLTLVNCMEEHSGGRWNEATRATPPKEHDRSWSTDELQTRKATRFPPPGLRSTPRM